MDVKFTRLAKLFIFYAIFYSILAAFCTCNFIIFLGTLDDQAPKRQLAESLIGDTPALNYYPKSYNNLIQYNSTDPTTTKFWIQQLEEFLAPYNPNRKKSRNIRDCLVQSDKSANTVCDFKLTRNFAPCLPQYNYGYDYSIGGPCIFLKLNKIHGWIPEFYNLDNVPPEMPHTLVENIKRAELLNKV